MKCANLGEKDIERVKDSFNCGTCKEEEDLKMIVQELVKRVEGLERGLTEEKLLRKEVEEQLKREVTTSIELESRVSKFEKKGSQEVKETIRETFEKEKDSFAAVLKKGMKEKAGGAAVVCEEMAGRETKKENIIFRGLEESELEGGGDRRQDDMSRVLDVLEGMNLGRREDVQENLLVIRRLGRREGNKKFRPLLLKFKDQGIRDRIIRNVKYFKDYNQEKNTRLKAEPDLTPGQQQRHKDMWVEANKRSKNGEQWVVWGPKDNPRLRKIQQH